MDWYDPQLNRKEGRRGRAAPLDYNPSYHLVASRVLQQTHSFSQGDLSNDDPPFLNLYSLLPNIPPQSSEISHHD